MAEISKVPAKTGTAPNAPPAVTWPSRIGYLRLPVQPEEEFERRDVLEEAQRLEQKRKHDAERGEDGDQ